MYQKMKNRTEVLAGKLKLSDVKFENSRLSFFFIFFLIFYFLFNLVFNFQFSEFRVRVKVIISYISVISHDMVTVIVTSHKTIEGYRRF